MSQPQLFVHPNDPNSVKILETLKAMNKSQLCKIYNIAGAQRQQLPPFLKSVPTLYLPDTKDVYVGSQIMAFIAKPVVARREVPAQPGQAQAQSAQADGGFTPWSFEGKGSLTELYSDWANPAKHSDSDQLNYTFLSGAPAQGPTEPQTQQSYAGDKQGRNDDVNSRLEQIKKMRESEFKGITRQ